MARRVAIATVVGLVVAGVLLTGGPAPAAPPAVTTTALTVTTHVGPGGAEMCRVDADLYVPASATAARPGPAILTTHGFGGSKRDQAVVATTFARRGYVVLAYSGLGFGGSDCKITLDDRDHDGQAASQLIRFLGGDPAIDAVDTGGHRVTVSQVTRDDATSGLTYDPRVGMLGGSYGGQVQFATAAVERRLDTIVPLITWNNLAYSLAPNNTAPGPGVQKYQWVDIFFAAGAGAGVPRATTDPSQVVGCPNFPTEVCLAKAQLELAGYPDATTTALMRNASVASYVSAVRIPTLLGQGQADTLFNLQESIATYRALRHQGTPVKLIWQSWGHSHSSPAPGELSYTDPESTVQGRAIAAWFDHYLSGRGPAPALDFSYFRDWVSYTGDAAPAYASAPAYPVGKTTPLYLSGSADLVASRRAVRPGQASWVGIAGPAAGSYTETSGSPVQGSLFDTPGTFVRYATAPLTADVDVVGVPTLDLRLSSDQVRITQASGVGGRLVLFAKLFDLAPDGSMTLAHRLISPVRVPDVTKPFRVELPGVVHRFPAGHRLAIALAATDLAYTNRAAVPQKVAVLTAPKAPGRLTLPLVAGAAGLPARAGAPVSATVGTPARPAPAPRAELRAAVGDRGAQAVQGFQVAGLAALAFGVSYLLAGRIRRLRTRRARPGPRPRPRPGPGPGPGDPR
jgi:predicted acyl esterase